MDERTKTLFSVLACGAIILTAGCGYNQSSKFQNSFLPPPPRTSALAALEIAEPPAVQPNLFLQDVPLLSVNAIPRRSRADALEQRAEQAFQRGKNLYQSDDIANARREFNSAVDLMLEASEQDPLNRVDYEKHLDAMVDSIHRFDLAGLGASLNIEDVQFEKAPLEDILQMTF